MKSLALDVLPCQITFEHYMSDHLKPLGEGNNDSSRLICHVLWAADLIRVSNTFSGVLIH